MRVYIIYDKRSGEIVHKYRLILAEESDSEDSADCEVDEVLASYRGQVPNEYLAVAEVSDYQPKTSRGRVTKYDEKTMKIVDQVAAPSPESTRTPGARRAENLEAGKD